MVWSDPLSSNRTKQSVHRCLSHSRWDIFHSHSRNFQGFAKLKSRKLSRKGPVRNIYTSCENLYVYGSINGSAHHRVPYSRTQSCFLATILPEETGTQVLSAFSPTVAHFRMPLLWRRSKSWQAASINVQWKTVARHGKGRWTRFLKTHLPPPPWL